MTESRSEATDRLRREGRWSEACVFREEMRQKFRGEGMKRADAVEASWSAMCAQYPPLPVVDEPTPAEPDQPRHSEAIAAILERSTESGSDLTGDVNWVYAHLGDAEIAPVDFPSLGAWSLWHWARVNSNRFFEQLLPKALAARQKRETEEAADRRERERLDDLEQMIDERKRAAATGLAEELGRDVKRAASTKFRTLSEWERQFQLPATSRKALDGLRARMVELAEKYVAEASVAG